MDHSTYFRLFTDRANKGDADAVKELQNAYAYGIDQLQTFDKDLVRYYRKTRGNPYSALMYGKMHLLGLGVKQDVPKGIRFVVKSKELGCAEARLILASANKSGVYNDESYDSLVAKVLEDGHPGAHYYLAEDFLEAGDEGNFLLHLERAADMGYGIALARLGEYYHDKGKYKKARHYYRRAMKCKSGGAAFNSGVMYREGEGVKVNLDKAVELFLRAIEWENVEAMTSLGTHYAEKGDTTRAKIYWKKAYQRDDPFACFNLGRTYWKEDKRRRALQAFLKGARLGQFDCLMWLNKMGIDPQTDEKDLDAVIKLLDDVKDMFGQFGAYDGDW